MNYFDHFHPAVIFIYFIAVLVLNMVFFDPVLFSVSLIGELVFYLYLKGFHGGMRFVWKCLVFLPICGGINMLINHRGVTVLFYMAGLPVTKECLFYGCMTGALLVVSLFLFGCYNHLMTSDRLMCLFGNRFPQLCLVFSMALRLVPKVKRDYKKLRETHKLQTGILTTLIGLSLEDSLETGIVMGYRGYGRDLTGGDGRKRVVRRTSICTRAMEKRDYFFLAVSLILLLSGAGIYVYSGTRLLVFPYIEYCVNMSGITAYLLLGVFINMPMVINVWEELKWKRIISRI